MRRVSTALAASAAALLFLPGSAGAITSNGLPDNGEHPYVGGLLSRADAPGTRCSGTMISPTVYLTAAHCVVGLLAAGRTTAFVTLDEHYVQGSSTIHPGTMYMDPGFGHDQHDSHDIAVVVLDQPVSLPTYGQLPAAGLLDDLKAAHQLKTATFEVVGYGVAEAVPGKGGQTFPGGDSRLKATESFFALNDTWIRLSQNQALGDGGACYGDSGGPNFLGDTNVVAAITITGDIPCYATNVVYRMDTDSARAFLAQFVALP